MKTTARTLHDGWTFRQTDPETIPNSDLRAWLPAVVPGHVHLDLLRCGAIPDPFERMYERSVQWVDEVDWAYRTTFAVDAAELDGARHVLRFAGLDTIATVLVNDEVVGTTDNMFIPHELDVTGALSVGENRLEVRFVSAERVGTDRLASAPGLDDHRPSRGLTARSMVRKAQYMWGWDWGPRLRSCGIWQPVTLVRVPAARLGDWSWRASFAPDGAATVVVAVNVEGAADAIEVRVRGHGADVTARGDGSTGISLAIPNAQRWWSAGLGDQPLYDLTISALVGGEPVDVIDARIGLREIELVREPDDAGESFFFRVNGVPIFAKGTNWIPDDSFPSRTTRERVRAQLELARGCGMNMVRIWGGGLYESTDFYDACDELGLLVWQDFPYACALYPEDDATVEAAVVEATAAVRRLRNHTSLALWCGNNENQWLASMGAFGKHEHVLGTRLYDEVLPAVVAAEDPTRGYWPSSPWGTGRDPSGEHDGDCHYWNVWHGEGDWVHYAKCTARFVSEFGFSGPPDIRTLEDALAPGDLGVDTPGMRWHDKTNKGYDTYLGYIALHYPMPTTLPDLVYYGQLNQADAMRFGIEHFRQLRPHTMGTLVWQLNDCWPVQSWAWIDYHLRPKAAWYAAKRFYAPLLLSLSRDGDQLAAHLVNDAVDARRGTLVVRAIGHDGSVLWSTTTDAAVDATTSVQVLDVELPVEVLAASRSAIVHATFEDVDATLLLAEPKDLALPPPKLRITTSADNVVALESDTLAASVMVWLDGADATWSDNFFHLLPGVRHEVQVTPSSDLSAAEVAARLRWRAL